MSATFPAKYVDASNQKMNLPNMLLHHQGSLPWTAGAINCLQLQLLGLLHHDMGMIVIVMSLTLFLGGDNEVGHAMTDTINTTTMQFLGTNLSDYDGSPFGRRVLSTEYVDVLIDWDGSMKWQRRKKKQL